MTITAQDIHEFNLYLQACSDSQVLGVLSKEVKAGRQTYAELASAEAYHRGLSYAEFTAQYVGREALGLE